MLQYCKVFLMGVLCTLFLGFAIFKIFHFGTASDISTPMPKGLVIAPDTVVIDRLPSYITLSGINVDFKGRGKFPQIISTRLAKNVLITSFRATGENAQKSSIKIIWEDGTSETVPAGISNRQFPPEKLAKEIIVFGYSVHERKVFHDTAEPGMLNWEILYEPVE